jgi:hypothetical protein
METERTEGSAKAASVLASWVEELTESGLSLQEENGRFLYPPLGLELAIAGLEVTEIEEGVILCPIYEVSHCHEESLQPIRVHAIGFGADLDEAARETACQWLEAAFPVLHSVYSDTRQEAGVAISELITVDEDSGQRYGWRVHLGPVLMRVFGEGDEPEPPGAADFARCLKAEISCLDVADELFWLECFASRDPDGNVDADCRLNNIEWPEGVSGLLTWANTWPYTPTQMVTKRQLIFFEPARISNLQDRRKLLRRLPGSRGDGMSWWNRLLRVGRSST